MADREQGKQAYAGTIRFGGALALVVLGLMLVSCGKKPGLVDPPPDVTDDKFPLTYPDPATDPKP